MRGFPAFFEEEKPGSCLERLHTSGHAAFRMSRGRVDWPLENSGNFSILHISRQHILLGLTSLIRVFCSTASPCISQMNCSGVTSRASDAVLGHLNRPDSSLL